MHSYSRYQQTQVMRNFNDGSRVEKHCDIARFIVYCVDLKVAIKCNEHGKMCSYRVLLTETEVRTICRTFNKARVLAVSRERSSLEL